MEYQVVVHHKNDKELEIDYTKGFFIHKDSGRIVLAFKAAVSIEFKSYDYLQNSNTFLAITIDNKQNQIFTKSHFYVELKEDFIPFKGRLIIEQ